nr:MAG TPA: hypothetical protein [Caudoviricetes sp.]
MFSISARELQWKNQSFNSKASSIVNHANSIEIQCILYSTLFIYPSIYNVFFGAYCSVKIKSLIKILLSILKSVLFMAFSCCFRHFLEFYLCNTNRHLFIKYHRNMHRRLCLLCTYTMAS